uniref:Uncharacterized protein n=1 Tax=Physcomitrium patens TaxID=3218 RepID=A0A2K1KEJ0_PHYPA|nr:hypothetical protein PHYPA_008567 [Physcomitrium patens]
MGIGKKMTALNDSVFSTEALTWSSSTAVSPINHIKKDDTGATAGISFVRAKCHEYPRKIAKNSTFTFEEEHLKHNCGCSNQPTSRSFHSLVTRSGRPRLLPSTTSPIWNGTCQITSSWASM